MFKVKEKYSGAFVSCGKFSVCLGDAKQDQLEHLFHLGHIAIEYIGKKPKNKQIDNFLNESDTKVADEQQDA
jgi:hypothetical protein